MTITPRKLQLIPDRLPMYLTLSEPHYDNFAQEVIKLPLQFAYRKTNGNDKRVRLVVNEYGWVKIYYLPTLPKGKIVPVEADSILESRRSYWTNSESLLEYWRKELHTFNEGQTYTLSRYSFDILTTEELDAIASSTFHHNSSTQNDQFKY